MDTSSGQWKLQHSMGVSKHSIKLQYCENEYESCSDFVKLFSAYQRSGNPARSVVEMIATERLM